MILGYVILDASGTPILSEMIPLSSSQMRWQDWTIEELSLRINHVIQLVSGFFNSEFEVMQSGRTILRRYDRQDDDRFHDLIVITDDKEDVMTHLALRKMVSWFRSVDKDVSESELRKYLNEIAFSVMVDTTRGLWGATSFLEMAELVHNMYVMLGYEDMSQVRENLEKDKMMTAGYYSRLEKSVVMGGEKKGSEHFIQWLKEWKWKPFANWTLSDLMTSLDATWERALVINAQLFLRATDVNLPLMTISDLRAAINSLDPSIFKRLLDAKLQRFESAGTYLLLNETIPEVREELQFIASLSDEDPQKASLFFILADVTKRPIQKMLSSYFERRDFVHWKAHCDEILFLIDNLRLQERATVTELKLRLEDLMVEQARLRDQAEENDDMEDNLDLLHRQVHLIVFLIHGLLNHPDLEYKTGIELLRSLDMLWDPLIKAFEAREILISNRLKGVYSYFMHASLQPLLIEFDIHDEPRERYLQNYRAKTILLIDSLVRKINAQRIEKDMAQIVLSSFLSSVATISYYLRKPLIDVLQIISQYTDETFFDQFEGSAFYHWGLFYSETNLALQFSALSLPLGSTKLNILGKLRDNLEYFMFNTPFRDFSSLFWPTLYRHFISCIKSVNESPNDLNRLLRLKNKILADASPFWKKAILELFDKHGITNEVLSS